MRFVVVYDGGPARYLPYNVVFLLIVDHYEQNGGKACLNAVY